jgi:ubiquinone/menaquinone biosynthesis C-methylase UbiE
MERQLFEQMYAGLAPWDIGRAQRAIVDLAEAGEIRGSVLDVGCGTGDNALYLASKGHAVTGLDFVPMAIDRARSKAKDRGVDARFEVGDALNLASLGRQFDTVIDCGLFHTFDDEQRPRFVDGLAAVLRKGGVLHVLCFSDREPGEEGPRRVTEREIRDTFAAPTWKIQRIEPTRFEINSDAERPMFTPGGPHAWLATIEREA